MKSLGLNRREAREPRWVGVIDAITRAGAVIVGLALLILLLTTVVDVAMRNAIGTPLPGSLAMVTYWWMPTIGIIGLGYIHLRNEQIVMTLLAENASERALRRLEIVVDVLVFGLVVLLLVVSWESAMEHFGYLSADSTHKWLPIWPGRFVLVAGLVIVLLAIPARIYRILKGTINPVPDEINEATE